MPQLEADWVAYAMHAPLAEQQPFGHDAAVQAQAPVALHACPCAHATHAAPWLPHVASVAVAHTPAAVQQPAHEPPPHAQTPLLHACPCAHATHAAPPRPHAATVGVFTQTSF